MRFDSTPDLFQRAPEPGDARRRSSTPAARRAVPRTSSAARDAAMYGQTSLFEFGDVVGGELAPEQIAPIGDAEVLPVAPSRTATPTVSTVGTPAAGASDSIISSLSADSRNLMHSSAGSDQDAALQPRLDLTAWRRLLPQLRRLRDGATADRQSTQGLR